MAALEVGTRLNSTKDLARYRKKHKHLLVGFSAESCLLCCHWEPLYQAALPALEARGVTWARVDADFLETKSLMGSHDIETLPAVVYFHGRKPVRLIDEQRVQALVGVVDRAREPVPEMSSTSPSWDAWRKPSALFRPYEAGPEEAADEEVAGLSLLRVAALFSREAEEEDLEELSEAARFWGGRPLSVRFLRGSDADTWKIFADHPLVSAACGGAAKAPSETGSAATLVALALFDGEHVEPARLRWPKLDTAGSGFGVRMLVSKGDASSGLVFNRSIAGTRAPEGSKVVEVLPRVACRPLDAYDDLSIQQWVLRVGLPPVGRFDTSTSALYEQTMKPMLMLFADPLRPELPAWLKILEDAHRRYNKAIADGGQEGWRLIFTYIDGKQFLHRMTSLGLTADLERQPALCFNYVTAQVLTWQPPAAEYRSGAAKLTDAVVDSVVQQYLGNEGHEAKERAAPKSKPVPKRNMDQGQRRDLPNLDTLSLSQRLRFVPALNRATFSEVVFDSAKDVMVYFFASSGPFAKTSKDAAIYINRCSERFEELGITTVRITRLDTTEFTAPEQVQVSEVPSLVLFPAFAKSPPYQMFRGKLKVQNIMWWIQEFASRPFKLPELPHLDELESQAYWEQKAELPEERQLRVAQASEASHQKKRRRRRSQRRAADGEL